MTETMTPTTPSIAGLAAVGGTATMASAQQSATDAAKGPKVWLDVDQQELDYACGRRNMHPTSYR